MQQLKNRSLALLAMLALAACSGSGSQGPAGPDGTDGTSGSSGAPGVAGGAGGAGPQGPSGSVTLTAESCIVCHAANQLADTAAAHKAASANALTRNYVIFSSVTIPAAAPILPVVVFTVNTKADGTGTPVTGLTSFNFTVAQLVPAASGGVSDWRSIINRNYASDGTTSVGGTTEISVAARSGSTNVNQLSGTLVEAPAGTYTYTFGNDLSVVKALQSYGLVTVAFDPALPTRIGLQSAAPIPGGTVTTVPATPPFTGTFDVSSYGAAVTTPDADPRGLVTMAACNACHQRLTVHGRRLDINYCVTCHNAYSFDPKTPADNRSTVDMRVMAHKIHMSENLPSVKAGTKYTINGADFSDIGFPQDLGNCTACHKATVAANGPAADNWKAKATIAACSSCHDRTSFADPAPAGFTLHSGGPQAADQSCSLCHAAGGLLGPDRVHAVGNASLSAEFVYTIDSVTNTQPGQFPVVTFSVKDGGGTGYNLQTDPAWTSLADGASRLAVILGWSTKDYANQGSGSKPGQPVSIDALKSAVATATLGTYSVTSPVAVPADAVGSGVAGIEGHPADVTVTPHARIPVTSKVSYFPITDTTAAKRRASVDVTKCNACHGNLSLHGNNRTGSTEICLICHNTEATDVNRRPKTGTTLDGLREASIDFKKLVHGLHGAEFSGEGPVIYGFGGSSNDFREVKYPGVLSNCEACHVAGAYNVSAAVNGTTITTGATSADNLRITKNMATCSACHTAPDALNHMGQMGGVAGITQGDIDALNK